MKLLLRETVDQLGTIGDIVNVPDGYGRNFLLPKGIALAVTPENIRRLEAKKQVLVAAEAEKRHGAESLAEKVKAKSVTIQAKAAGDEGKLYGSVTTQAIADQFVKDGLPIEARMILLDQPIKELGVFDVRLRLFPQVEVEAKVWVVDESAGAQPLPQAQASAERAEGEKPGKPAREKKAKLAKDEAAAAAAKAEADVAETSAADNEAALFSQPKPKKEKKEKGRRR